MGSKDNKALHPLAGLAWVGLSVGAVALARWGRKQHASRPAAGTKAAAANGVHAANGSAHNGHLPARDAGAEEPVHIVGSSVNLPDMSAHLAAKVSVSSDQQADPKRLAAIYDDMVAKFLAHGLNLPAVEAVRQYFRKLEGEGMAEPLDYALFAPPLPPGAVRLCVVFFQETNRRLMELVHEAAQDVMAALPPGTKFHLNRPSHYHITVFMTSQPHTLRPDPFVPGGGLPADRPSEEQAAAARPDPDTLLQEIAEMRSIAETTPAPALEVHRLLLADSGTLLLCSVDKSGNLARLRARLRGAFPGAPATQSTIMHASIARVLSPAQMSAEQIARVQAACDRWSERLRGMHFDPVALYHICENTFTTVEGPRIPLPFQQPGPAGGGAPLLPQDSVRLLAPALSGSVPT